MRPGEIGWIDLTIEDAPRMRDFYRQVVGWSVDELSMGDYPDFVMKSGDEPVAGICHSRCENAVQPRGWMIYILSSRILNMQMPPAKRAAGASWYRLESWVRVAMPSSRTRPVRSVPSSSLPDRVSRLAVGAKPQ
jgi:hypothetical protein